MKGGTQLQHQLSESLTLELYRTEKAMSLQRKVLVILILGSSRL